MNVSSTRGSWLGRPAVVATASFLAILGSTLLLWSPWERTGREANEPLLFYCAAGLSTPVQEIVRDFEKLCGVEVHLVFDKTGSLLSTLRTTRGRGDLYLAADASYITRARSEGLVRETFDVGVLRPVLVANQATAQRLAASSEGLRILLRPELKVVFADLRSAAVGKAAREACTRHGLWAPLQKELDGGGNRVSTVGTVNEVALAVRQRDDTVGIVWDGTARLFDGLTVLPARELEEARDTMQLGVLEHSRNSAAALKLARYLCAPERGGKVFARHGFTPAEQNDAWVEHPRLLIAAGAMLKPGVEDAFARFSRREGVALDTMYGGCGHLTSAMKTVRKNQEEGDARRPFPDAFFACDTSFLDDVQQWFEAGRILTENDMVVVVPSDNPRGVDAADPLAALARKDLRVGLADPVFSALGRLTDDLLRKLDLYDRVHAPDRRFPISTVPEAHMLVAQVRSGGLDAAVVYRSNVLSAPDAARRHLLVLEPKLERPARAVQPFALSKTTPHRRLLLRLRDALTTAEAADHFRARGFHWRFDAAAPSNLPGPGVSVPTP